MDASRTPAVLPVAGRTILVVENNALVRRSLVTFVGSLGFRVIAVRSAEEALQVAPSRPIHIVLTDLFLPMRNGIQLVKLLFDLGVRTPAVLLTGYISERARREADEAGIAAVLEKPHQLDRLGYTLVGLCGNPSTVNHHEQ